MSWIPATEMVASEGGVPVADEIHLSGARITLERDCSVAPWAITCGIYGLFVHTTYRGDEVAARRAFEEMKCELARILALNEDREISQAVDDFVDRF